MNKVILIGNLTKDPEVSETSNGIARCTFSIAVSRDYTSADGTRETDFFNVTVWRGRAEVCGRYLHKGNKVCVVGSLQNRSYEDQNGQRRTITDVVANEVEFLTPKNQQSEDDGAPVRRERPQLEALDDNQLPF